MAVLVLLGASFVQEASASETTETVAASTSTTETEWIEQPWGTMGAARLKNAPFPDESRKNGLKTKDAFYPVENHYDDNTVVFAIPKSFHSSSAVDLIFHFHGHRNDARKALNTFQLGQQLADSHRNAILVVPQGPKDAPDSSGGKLEREGVFGEFVKEIIETLQSDGKLPRNAKVRNIILSGHSGGYKVVGRILAVGGMDRSIKEVWLFDAAYGGLSELASPFATPDTDKRLRSIFTDHLMDENVTLMGAISLGGGRIFIAEDDQFTTDGTSEGAVKALIGGRKNAKPGVEELPGILKRERNLFFHTSLSHNDLVMKRKYFQLFTANSPFLEPTRKTNSRKVDDDGP